MAGNKHEIDGETFIISDDVDLDELDLEKMVEKGDSPKIVEYVRAYGAEPSSPPPLPSTPHVPVERIWLTLDLKQEGTTEIVPCACIMEGMYVGEQSSYVIDALVHYKALMSRETALKIAMLSMRSATAGVALFVERLCGSFEKLEEELIFEENGKMRLSRFHMWDTKLDNAFIEVEFYIAPIKVGD